MPGKTTTGVRSAGQRVARKVALLIETDRAYGRGILRGISRWVHDHGGWSLYIEPGSLKQAIPKLEEWGCDGVVARIATPTIDREISRLAVPTILLAYRAGEHQVRVGTQSAGEGDLAARHFLDRGFRHFAFCGHPEQFSIERFEGFASRLARDGFSVHEYRRRWCRRDRWWTGEQEHMGKWLVTLPQPLAVFAATDDVGRRVLEACQSAGLYVPDQVAVLGVDNDELLCDLCVPPLSSIALSTENAGFQVAEALESMMAGRSPRQRTIIVEPAGVVTRQSTDVLAIDDLAIAMAIRFVREHAHERITVRDILRLVPLSRRSLESRFKLMLGRTPHAEILRARLERAKRLLATSDMSMPRVASECGFASADYMGYVFRRVEGQTPLAYRKRMRLSEG